MNKNKSNKIITPLAYERTYNSFLRRIVSPQIVDSILDNALGSGSLSEQEKLFSLMQDTWPRLLKNLNQVKRAVSSLKWEVKAFSPSQNETPTDEALNKAKLITNAFNNFNPNPSFNDCNFENTLYNLCDAYFSGIEVCEIIYKYENSCIMPTATSFLDARFYGYPTGNEIDRLMFSKSGQANDFIDFPKNKFLIAKCPSRKAHPSNAGLFRCLAKYWIGSEFGYKWFCSYAEKFGTPLRFAHYPEGQEDTKNELASMLENMGNFSWGVFPSGTEIKLHTDQRAPKMLPQIELMEIANKACDILILGQTLTTDVQDSGSRALGDVHNGVKIEMIENLKSFLAEIINYQLIPAIIDLNFADKKDLPYICFEDLNKEDELLMSQRDKVLFVDIGLPIDNAYLYDRYDLKRPNENANDLFIKPSLQSPSGVNAKQVKKNDKEILEENILKELKIDEALWLKPAKKIFSDLIKKAQDKNLSDEDFLKAIKNIQNTLPDMFDDLDVNALQEAFERAMGVSYINELNKK